MKSKILISVFAILAVALVTGIVSADASLSISNENIPSSVKHDDGSFQISFDLANSGDAANIDWSASSVSHGAEFSFSEDYVGESDTVNVIATITFDEQQTGTISGNIVATPDTGSPASLSFSVPIDETPELTITKVTELTKSQDGVIRIKNTGNVPVNDIELTQSGDFVVSFSSFDDDLSVGEEVDVTISSDDLNNLKFGDNSVTITATGNGASDSIVLTVKEGFCKNGLQGGNLVINDVQIDNLGEGKDDKWKLLDTIEIEVEVENDGDDDVDDVIVELAIFDNSGDDITNDFEFENDGEEEIDLGNFNDGDDDTATFRFRVPADVADGNYKVAVKVYSDDLKESNECSDVFDGKSYEEVEIERESDEGKFIAFEDIVLTPMQATCGETIRLTADVYNIGDEDQDQVKVSLISSDLNVDEFIEIRNDMDEGDKESVEFEFTVPQNVKDGIYYLSLTADYDYRRGNYRESLDEPTKVGLKISGCGIPSGERIALINAVLESDAKAGEELIIKGSITNLMNEEATFVVSALGYESWSSLKDISDRIITIDAGQSKDIIFKFDVDSDVEGEETFTIEARTGDEVETREVAVNIEGISGRIPQFGLGDNTLIWVIGIINVVLIILIIIVAIRISRR